MVIFWLANRNYLHDPINEIIRDIIHAISFLTLFILQKAFNHFTGSLHVKLNEIVSSSETADKSVINVESKTEPEIIELQKEYNEPAKQTKIDATKENIYQMKIGEKLNNDYTKPKDDESDVETDEVLK
ncbi:MAG: low affinity iron permease family protein, partial [Chitinophagaceae bacterium]|nr:low affinity iron permease family protein [Chitinophagaceae bacterium]